MSLSSYPPSMNYGYLFANIQEEFKAAFLEFIGTAFFILLGLGGIQAATIENAMSTIDQVLYIRADLHALQPFSLRMAFLPRHWRLVQFKCIPRARLRRRHTTCSIRAVLHCPNVRGDCRCHPWPAFCRVRVLYHHIVVNSSKRHQLRPGHVHRNVPALVLAVLMLAAENHQATPFAPVRRCSFLVLSCHASC